MKKTPQIMVLELAPTYAISAYAYGESPEVEAWNKLEKWALSKGLCDDFSKQIVFGFDNPPPDPKLNKYGFEFWMKVNEAITPEGDLRLIFFKGGKYAMMHCEIKGDPQNITKGWMKLMKWAEENNYEIGSHQGLEKFLNGIDLNQMVLELYCPIRKK